MDALIHLSHPLTRLGLWPIHPLPDGERNKACGSILLPIGEKVARSVG